VSYFTRGQLARPTGGFQVDKTALFAASAAALIIACITGWAVSDTQARAATSTVRTDAFQIMTSAKQLPTQHFADYAFVF
jgi:hypothetical protein